MNNKLITRKEYMENSSELHHVYYSQFCNEAIIRMVKLHFPKDLQNYELHQWDKFSDMTRGLIDIKIWKQANEYTVPGFYPWSLSDNVCILKAAHKIIKETNNA